MTKKRAGMQGKLYQIRSQTSCVTEGIPYNPLPKGVAGHRVVVLSQPDGQGRVKIATITTSPRGDIRYYPIAPTPRRPYPFQLHIRDYNNQYIGSPRALPFCSYLRAEEHVVSSRMLLELQGDFGEHLMLKNESVTKLASALRGEALKLQ